jgi:hypothetical protein
MSGDIVWSINDVDLINNSIVTHRVSVPKVKSAVEVHHGNNATIDRLDAAYRFDYNTRITQQGMLTFNKKCTVFEKKLRGLERRARAIYVGARTVRRKHWRARAVSLCMRALYYCNANTNTIETERNGIEPQWNMNWSNGWIGRTRPTIS